MPRRLFCEPVLSATKWLSGLGVVSALKAPAAKLAVARVRLGASPSLSFNRLGGGGGGAHVFGATLPDWLLNPNLISLKWGQLAAVEDELGQKLPFRLGRVSKPNCRGTAAG